MPLDVCCPRVTAIEANMSSFSPGWLGWGGRMIYGMYLSAAGMISSSYRQDVVANNLANSETVGFKRDLALLQERPSAGDQVGQMLDTGDASLNKIGGG